MHMIMAESQQVVDEKRVSVCEWCLTSKASALWVLVDSCQVSWRVVRCAESDREVGFGLDGYQRGSKGVHGLTT